jgi:PAS domain S-box-containing protein
VLNLTHDIIFVRNMSDVITYWNRGAQELFGWTAEEAIGKHAHQLLQTVFPMPIDAVDAELLRTGGWEGELEKIKADGTRVVVSGRWSLVRDEQERPVAILATNNDITQRKRSDEIGCADGGEDEIVVFIRDNGIGFDMKYVKKLFGVFQRLHRTEEFEGRWYGIG